MDNMKNEDKADGADRIYDFISLGYGATGMAGAIYAARFNLKALIIGSQMGGVLNDTDRVENYPGFVKVGGIELMTRFKEQAEQVGVKIVEDLITEVKKLPDKDGKPFFEVATENNGIYHARTILFALGSKRRLLNIPGEREFASRGVSYCAICDAAFFKGKTVAVVGGSDSACIAALIVADHAAKTYIIYRRDKLRGEPINVSRVNANPMIEVIYNTNVLEIRGKNVMESVILDKPYYSQTELRLDGLFVEIGSTPNSEFARKLGVATDEKGRILMDKFSRTNISGVFAAGDVADTPMEQIITGVAEACVAAQSAYELLQE